MEAHSAYMGVSGHFSERMNNVEIVRTSCKIFGLYFIVQVVFNLRDVFFYFIGLLNNSDNGGFVMLFGTQTYLLIFNLVAGLIFIYKSDAITSKLGASTSDQLKLTLDKVDLIELVIIGICIMSILYSVPEIIFKLVNYTYFNDFDRLDRPYFWTNKNKADVFYSVFKFTIGLIFLFNARNFARRLHRIGEKEDKREL